MRVCVLGERGMLGHVVARVIREAGHEVVAVPGRFCSSAPQEFAVVSGDVRTTQTPEAGHLTLVVSGTGREHKVRVLPLGDAQYKARRFTLFNVTVTPLL